MNKRPNSYEIGLDIVNNPYRRGLKNMYRSVQNFVVFMVTAIFGLVGVAVVLGVPLGILYIIYHFVTKYW